MYDFTGCECPVCHQEFRAEDDMVVCPECGAPYHRACYEKTGSCIYRDRHAGGFEWVPPRKAQQASEQVCAVCGTSNAPDSRYCRNCGTPLAGAPGAGGQVPPRSGAERTVGPAFDYSQLYNNSYTPGEENPYAAEGFGPEVAPNEMLDGIPASDWASYIGPSHQVYLLVFKQMELLQRKISFSFSAMLLGPFYFLYRKAWKPALLFTALMMLTSTPAVLLLLKLSESPLVAGLSTGVINGLISAAGVLNLAVIMLRGLFGFYLYKRSAAERIRQIREAYPDSQRRSYVLRAQGGTSIGAVLCLVAVIFVLSLLIDMFLLGPNLSAVYAYL